MSSLEQAAEGFSKASQTPDKNEADVDVVSNLAVRQVEEATRKIEPLKTLLPQKSDLDSGKLLPSYNEVLEFLKVELEKDPKKVAEDLLALIKPASCLPSLFSWFTRK
jgi:hypothetical protein